MEDSHIKWRKMPLRMTVKTKHAIFFALLLLPVAGSASDSAGLSAGSVPTVMGSCGTYIAARDKERNGDYVAINAHIAWLLGYISAYNKQTPDTYDIRGGKELDALLVWLENYCKQHRLEEFGKAVNALVVELYPTRARTSLKKK